MSSYHLTCAEQDPLRPATATVLWMHGLGAPWDFVDFTVGELDLPEEMDVRFILPQAPPIPVTINNGYRMPAWYDILGMTPGAPQDEAGIRANAERVRALVDREIARGILPERIVLAGFSQGGAMALFAGLRFPTRLAGIAALSAYLLLPDTLDDERSDAAATTPIFQAHGTRDGMVPVTRGRESCERLRQSGFDVDWHEYPMEHAVHPEEIDALRAWLIARLG